MKAQSWLWPDHTIGKRESRQLREEHNVLVNIVAELQKACIAAEDLLAGYDQTAAEREVFKQAADALAELRKLAEDA